ncbi:MAG TPA: TonB-dependent receptor [Steroidobacteraceae bacterium]|jgi:iron complex outermembrane receptor protein|nr:TonB-dependent receptor [Steroidobacteraceae bacterium]
MRFSANALFGAASFVVSAFTVSQAFAQAAPADNTADSGQLQEVTVTAQFRAQNLQETPIAITAVTAAMLEQRNQTDISQVAGQAPNVTLQPNGAAFGSSMVAFIRGVGQTDFNLALEPGVGIYVDDVYYATLTGSVLDLLDLDRVEILRGPQGTLAGKNSIGGAIKLFSQKPTGDGSGYLEATAGSLNRVDARGAGDFKLTDTLFARVSFATKHHDGYVKRLDYACTHPGSNVPGHTVGDGCELGRDGSQAFDAGRLALRWLPRDDLEVNLTGDVTNDQSGVQANTLIKFNPASLGAATFTTGLNGAPIVFGPQFIPYGPQSQDPNRPNDPYLSYATYTSDAGSFVFGDDPYAPLSVPPINHFKTWGASAEIQWSMNDKLTLTSVTAYRNYTNQFAEQTDASPVGVQILLQRQKHHQFSQELRLNGTAGTSVDWTVGAFYLDQDGGLNARVGLPWVGFDFIHGPDSTPAKTKAAFANADWRVAEKLTVGAGARYSDETKTYTYFRHNGDGTDVQPAPAYNNLVFGLNGRSATFSGTRTDYRVHLDYQITPDVMTYVQTATGYKGGGVNPRPFFPSQTLSFDPETLTAYEIGLKTSLLDHHMRFNTAAFYNRYNDIQLTLSNCPTPPLNGIQYPSAPCALPANVGSAHVKGIELETEIRVNDYFEVDASGSWLDFKYTSISDPTTGITSDMTTPYTPKWKGSLGAQYEMPIGTRGSITPRLDLAYQSSQFANAINDPLWNEIAGYTVLNARVTWRNSDASWQAALNVTNVTDKLYYLTLFDTHTSAGYVNGQPAMPREWSISVKHNF